MILTGLLVGQTARKPEQNCNKHKFGIVGFRIWSWSFQWKSPSIPCRGFTGRAKKVNPSWFFPNISSNIRNFQIKFYRLKINLYLHIMTKFQWKFLNRKKVIALLVSPFTAFLWTACNGWAKFGRISKYELLFNYETWIKTFSFYPK